MLPQAELWAGSSAPELKGRGCFAQQRSLSKALEAHLNCIGIRAYRGPVLLKYSCDWCNRVKKRDEGWILGFAAERRGARSSQLELQVLSRWSDYAAQDPLAVHFCSVSHQRKYFESLLGTTAAQPRRCERRKGGVAGSAASLRSQTVAGASRRRSDQRIFPAESLTAGAESQKSTTATPMPEGPKSAKRRRRSPRFTSADITWAREIGVALGTRKCATE